MQIGEVIRKYRKSADMTQEEMANRLGVTAPAVNKWENGNSYPDITLLAPIARLLGISTDELLSYREELSSEEIQELVRTANTKFQEENYEDVFRWIKKELELYPNCEQLIWQMAVMLDANRLLKGLPDSDDYDDYICSCYTRVLSSKDETLRYHAADSLFGFYMRKEEYETAGKYLQYLSVQNPERKRKQAEIYQKTGRIQEAYKTYEELLFAEYQVVSGILTGMYMLALQEHDSSKAHLLIEKQSGLARLFEMGKYYEISCRLDLAAFEKDAKNSAEIMSQMLDSVDDIFCFRNSPLYEHMTFKEPQANFIEKLKNNLILCFQDKETFNFLEEQTNYANE
ncbi:helix-turn-helix domain-containing protein [Bariatricus sp. HCP28S3_E4]|uniref:helix-turn-helix domain-containing protein n=1 Tax=Lachnospiraceae TaxID=186803 RepID=UPI002A7E6594|nr:helix-turn-helix domain-containing protein [bacterium]MDY2884302.1 helix-turn-helix domain-containing protein [Bariatricus sp.]